MDAVDTRWEAKSIGHLFPVLTLSFLYLKRCEIRPADSKRRWGVNQLPLSQMICRFQEGFLLPSCWSEHGWVLTSG